MGKKAQSTLEYVVIVLVIIAALLAMQIWVKRGLQGKLRSSTDDIGEQFSPGITTGTMTTTSNSITRETIQSGVTTSNMNTYQNREGGETVQSFDSEPLSDKAKQLIF